MTLNSHGCSACEEVYPSGQWEKQQLWNHSGHNRPLVCKKCSEEGYSARNQDRRQCSKCKKVKGHGKFQEKDQIKNRKRFGENISCICIDCANKEECGGCGALVERTAMKKSDLSYKRDHPDSLLLCAECRTKGLTKQDGKLYVCTSCGQELGAKRFKSETLKDRNRGRMTKLECADCVQRIEKRLKVLETALKKSKRICTCHQLLHTSKCALTPCYAGEKRWPGSDGYINRVDMEFLNDRKPPPKWWWRAWGRR